MSVKTALITGGTKGIGKAIALAFLERGYEVVLNYCHDERSALATQEEFNMLGYCPVLLRADVSDEAHVRAMFKEFFSIYEKLDVLVNNAGVSLIKVIQETKIADWNRVFDINVKGTYLCSREVTDKMIFAGGGAIVNIASIWGEVGASCEVAYSASKGAIYRLYESACERACTLQRARKLRFPRRYRHRNERPTQRCGNGRANLVNSRRQNRHTRRRRRSLLIPC